MSSAIHFPVQKAAINVIFVKVHVRLNEVIKDNNGQDHNLFSQSFFKKRI